jgi:transketolase
MRLLGVPGEFAPTGSPAFLFEHFGLSPEGISESALELLEDTACGTREVHLGD